MMVAAKWWLFSQSHIKLFNSKPILGFRAALFFFIFAVFSSLDALFALFPG